MPADELDGKRVATDFDQLRDLLARPDRQAVLSAFGRCQRLE
jgi:hypothetical protein